MTSTAALPGAACGAPGPTLSTTASAAPRLPRRSRTSRRSRVGSTRKSSTAGMRRPATPSLSWSFSSIGMGAAGGAGMTVTRRGFRDLLFTHDGDGHFGDDLGVELDAHRVLAERLDAPF